MDDDEPMTRKNGSRDIRLLGCGVFFSFILILLTVLTKTTTQRITPNMTTGRQERMLRRKG